MNFVYSIIFNDLLTGISSIGLVTGPHIALCKLWITWEINPLDCVRPACSC